MQAIRSRVPGILHPTLVVGLISGGINTNVVPDRVTLRLDRRIIPEEDAHAVERELLPSSRAPAPDPASRSSRAASCSRCRSCRDPGRTVSSRSSKSTGARSSAPTYRPRACRSYTDARHYSEAGIPTVLYGAGPRSLAEARGHAADERLVLDDLRKATQTVALTIADLLR